MFHITSFNAFSYSFFQCLFLFLLSMPFLIIYTLFFTFRTNTLFAKKIIFITPGKLLGGNLFLLLSLWGTKVPQDPSFIFITGEPRLSVSLQVASQPLDPSFYLLVSLNRTQAVIYILQTDSFYIPDEIGTLSIGPCAPCKLFRPQQNLFSTKP